MPVILSRFLGALCWSAEFVNCFLNFFFVPLFWLVTGIKSRDQLLNSSSYKRYGRWTYKIFGISIEQINPREIDLSKQFILIANHSSWFDQPIFGLVPQQPMHFLAKAGYKKIPVLAQALMLHQCVFVDPNHRERVVFEVNNYLAKGHSVCLYPEGTRNNGRDLIPVFKNGAFLFASQNRVPILPVYIQNAEKILVKGRPLTSVNRGVRVRVYIGDPITVLPGQEEQIKRQDESKFIKMQGACRHSGSIQVDW